MRMIILLLMFFTLTPHLQARSWEINKDHSELFFSVPYINVSEVTGRFNDFSGAVEYGEASLPREVSLRIRAASIDTGNRLRDGHLKSHDFLKTQQYPDITFVSDDIRVVGSGLKAKGNLTIAGVTRTQVVQFSLSESVKDSWNFESRFVKFETRINRQEFNIKWNKTLTGDKFLIGDEIRIFGTFQLQPARAATPGSKHMLPDNAYMRRREKILRGELPAERMPVPLTTPAPSPVEREVPPHLPAAAISREGRDFRQSLSWQLAFGLLGLMGFFASIIIGLYSKKVFSEAYVDKYREGGHLGVATDAITIVFVFIFIVALWEVGWG